MSSRSRNTPTNTAIAVGAGGQPWGIVVADTGRVVDVVAGTVDVVAAIVVEALHRGCGGVDTRAAQSTRVRCERKSRNQHSGCNR